MADTAHKTPIPYISPEQLRQVNFLQDRVYPNSEINYYWSDCWSPSFYVELAKSGFISVAMDHEQLGPILMPEIQTHYALLDWENLHVSTKVKKILNRENQNPGSLSLKFTNNPERVCKAIEIQFGSENWLSHTYKELVLTLCKNKISGFCFHAVELQKDSTLVAGELGYTIGAVYTSLTGFSSREKSFNNMGKVQLVLLAEELKKQGYAFWNLGHPYMEYKLNLGARVLPRKDFLKRWMIETPKSPRFHGGKEEIYEKNI